MVHALLTTGHILNNFDSILTETADLIKAGKTQRALSNINIISKGHAIASAAIKTEVSTINSEQSKHLEGSW
jgi:hypothetical protein